MASVRLRIIGECVIEVGDRHLTPESTHLFALLLYLCVERGRAVSRVELCDMLFPRAGRARALHNLRQLLYRLRSMGVPVDASTLAVAFAAPDDVCLLGRVGDLPPESRCELTTHQLVILPAYEPSMSVSFADWLAALHHRVEGQLRVVLLNDLRAFRGKGDSRAVLKVGRLLAEIDEANPEVTCALAEALAIAGKRMEAIVVLDQYLVSHSSHSHAPDMRALRARIGKVKPHVCSVQATLHGRQDALSGLKSLWASAKNEHPQLCVLIGVPGIGKTRLATEFGGRVVLEGGRTLVYRCDASDTERPLAAFSQLVPQMRAMRGALGVSPATQRCLDLLSGDYTTSTPPEPAAVEWARGELPVAITDLVEAVTSEQPLLVVLDDAHLLHSASWNVLNRLCDRRGTASVMVLCCCRSAEMDRVSSSSGALASVISLIPLTDSQSRAVLQELIPDERLDSVHVDWCIAQAAGNPFYLHALAQRDAADERDDSLPFDIRRLASSSYHSLDAPARALLEACLFLGKFSTMRRTREVAGIDSQYLVSALRTLEHRGLLTSTSGNLNLSHALLEEAIRPLVPTAVATALHDRIAAHLQAEYDSSGHSVALAWAAADHWLLAGDGSAALRLLRRCAAQAASVGEPSAAMRTLLKVPYADLPSADRASILDEAIGYADLAGDWLQVQSLLSERTSLARADRAARRVIKALQRRTIEATLEDCPDPSRWLDALAVRHHLRMIAAVAPPLHALRSESGTNAGGRDRMRELIRENRKGG